MGLSDQFRNRFHDRDRVIQQGLGMMVGLVGFLVLACCVWGMVAQFMGKPSYVAEELAHCENQGFYKKRCEMLTNARDLACRNQVDESLVSKWLMLNHRECFEAKTPMELAAPLQHPAKPLGDIAQRSLGGVGGPKVAPAPRVAPKPVPKPRPAPEPVPPPADEDDGKAKLPDVAPHLIPAPTRPKPRKVAPPSDEATPSEAGTEDGSEEEDGDDTSQPTFQPRTGKRKRILLPPIRD